MQSIINLQNEDGMTPLMIAINECANNCVSSVEALVKARADVNIQDKNGNTALMIACRNNNICVPAVEALVKAQADINIQNKNGDTALMIACRKSDRNNIEPIFKILIDRTDINLQNNEDNTVLMLICKYCNYNIVTIAKMLLDKGSKIDIQNKLGYTALSLACTYNNVLVPILIESGIDNLVLDESTPVTRIDNLVLDESTPVTVEPAQIFDNFNWSYYPSDIYTLLPVLSTGQCDLLYCNFPMYRIRKIAEKMKKFNQILSEKQIKKMFEGKTVHDIAFICLENE